MKHEKVKDTPVTCIYIIYQGYRKLRSEWSVVKLFFESLYQSI